MTTEMCKDLRQTKMEAFYLELLTKLIKIMGTNIATEIIKTPPRSEHRLYQAIVIQAFEDCLYTLGGKNEAYNKKEAHEWFMSNST